MNRKIRKLTDMIEEAKKEVKELEDKLEKAKHRLDKGEIIKADFTKARMQLSERIKGKRTMIARWEKARLNEERRLKEKKEDEEEEVEKRHELRSERRREREKEKRRRAKSGDGGDGKESKPKGFFSFLFGN
jgi:chromosome segregation ATPase